MFWSSIGKPHGVAIFFYIVLSFVSGGTAVLISDGGHDAQLRPCFSQGTGDLDFIGTWTNTAATPAYRNLSCPLECSKYSCYHQGQLAKAGMAAHYRFEATSCVLKSFDAPAFVRTLGRRRLYLVGDSLQRQIYISLGCLTADLVATYNTSWRDVAPCHGTKKCIRRGPHGQFERARLAWKTGAEMHFIGMSEDMLDELGQTDAPMDTRGRVAAMNTETIFSMLRGGNLFSETDIVFMNIGFHYNCDQHRELVQKFGHVMSSRKAGPTVIYRETSAMHFHGSDTGAYPGTNAYTPKGQPTCVPGPVKPSCYVNNERELLYGRVKFMPGWNITAGLGALKIGEGNLFGVGDCVHWCMPGVPDIYSNVFFNLLLSA